MVNSNQSVSDGTGWSDKLDDAATLAMLVAAIGAQQKKLAASRHTGLNGEIDRAQHQKQLLGALGTIRIAKYIPEAARFGPFAGGRATYRVACRISNGQPSPQPDTAPDVRGIALKFFTKEGVETDLLMTNEGGRSHARDAAQFMAVADIIAALLAEGTVSGIAQGFREMMMARLGPVEGARILAILFKETRVHHVASVATEHYWGSVVQLGQAAVKYSLHPHPSTPEGTNAERHGDNYLRADIFNRLEQGPVKWQLGVQFFVDEATTPVNDASVAWKSDMVMIGELELDAPPSADDEARVDRLAFNPANGFAPLGITHARKEVYAASAANREGRGVLSSDEARALLGAR
ncbi:Catalase-related peroxidase [Caballeronia temeraria]|uniref:catalase n=1 Tax=Caballeronia temeraria TaxID=1777137 RepID=A0A158B8R3_9BURK|nr:catalase [Caballeronia temeraria]SAK66471.1 Catalase-related peroxidase [Caballeronia temeraria]